MPTISSIDGSALSARSTLVPTLPVAPTTATRIRRHRPGERDADWARGKLETVRSQRCGIPDPPGRERAIAQAGATSPALQRAFALENSGVEGVAQAVRPRGGS